MEVQVEQLWSVAEGGNVTALATILSRGVEVNARNVHGMTALMRAARLGHAPSVRALLEHGADPNIARNDRFTALALAAFFGHTETVRILIEYGAKTEIVTRSGTSPRMWATARTFTEVARCMEQPAKAAATVRRAVVTAPVIKTLTDPPEIWDLVHEVPQGFDPRSAFVARMRSMKRPVVVGAFAAVLFAISCGVTAFVFRSSQASSASEAVPPVQTAAEVQIAPPVPVESAVTQAPVTVVDNRLAAHVVRQSLEVRQTRQRPVFEDRVVEVTPPSREVSQVAVPEVEKPRPRETPMKSAPNAALSPHLITPAGTKSKVIQWP